MLKYPHHIPVKIERIDHSFRTHSHIGCNCGILKQIRGCHKTIKIAKGLVHFYPEYSLLAGNKGTIWQDGNMHRVTAS